MPHCILECSDNLVEKPDNKKVLSEIHDALMQTSLFKLDDIKSRAIEHHDYLIGDGDSSRAFITLSVAILSGRTDQTKKMISDLCLDVLKRNYARSLKVLKLSITVRVEDIHKESYGREISY